MENQKENKLYPAYIGFDISTTCIGISVLTIEGKLVELKHLKLQTTNDVLPENRYLIKGDIFKNFVLEYIERLEEKYQLYVEKIFVEEPLILSKNPNTASMLQRFNGVCCYILATELNIIPELISVYEARKLFCPEFVRVKKNKNGEIVEIFSPPKKTDIKKYILEKVDKREKTINWVYNTKNNLDKVNYDMSDAYCVTFSGMKKNGIIKS
ncbi:MAG: hypothetical protein ACOC33_00345 [bacterium]